MRSSESHICKRGHCRLFLFHQARPCRVAQKSLDFDITLPQTVECRDERPVPPHLAQCHCCHLLAGKGHPAHPAAAGESRPELEGVWPANKGLAEIGKSFGSCAFTLPDSVP